jgi:fumarate hydratase class II
MATAVLAFAERCIDGISANREICKSYLEKSLALATALVPAVGYDKAAAVAKRAYEEGKTVREVAGEMEVLPAEQIDKLLDKMIEGKSTQ